MFWSDRRKGVAGGVGGRGAVGAQGAVDVGAMGSVGLPNWPSPARWAAESEDVAVACLVYLWLFVFPQGGLR